MSSSRSRVAACVVMAAFLRSISSTVAAGDLTSPMAHQVDRLSSNQLMYRGEVYTKAQLQTASLPQPATLAAQACDDAEYLTYACDPTRFIGAVCCVVVLVMLAGAMSGLTVGVLSLDTMHLSVLKMEGSTTARKAAARLLPVLTHHRLLLVTLVFMNALANEALPIFLNTLINPIASVVFSVTFVVLFGEIVPTALCTGERQLVIGAACVPLLRGLIRLTYPLSYPISVLLNHTVGETSSNLTYSRDELKALVQLQHIHNPQAGLTSGDVELLQCVLDLGKRSVRDCMTPVTPITDVVAPPPAGVPLGSHLLNEVSATSTPLVYAHETGLYPVVDGACRDMLPYIQVEPATSLSALLAIFLRNPAATMVVVVASPTAKSANYDPLTDVVGIVRRQDLPVFQTAPRQELKLTIDVDDEMNDDTTENSSNESTSPTMAPPRLPRLFFSPKDDVAAYARVSCVDDMEELAVVTAATCS